MQKIQYKSLIQGSLVVSVALVLSQFKIFSMPQGGSVSLSFLPLLIYAKKWEVRTSSLAGFVFGVLHFFLDPAHVLHPVSILFDYLLPSVAICLVSIGKNKNTTLLNVEIALCFVVKFLLNSTSGAIVFASYAPQSQSPWVYSMIYNSYIFVEAIIVMILFNLIECSMPNGRKR